MQAKRNNNETLVTLLKKHLKAWPDGAKFIVQDADGMVWPSQSENAEVDDGYWNSKCVPGTNFKLKEVAIDQAEAKVTQAQWAA